MAVSHSLSLSIDISQVGFEGKSVRNPYVYTESLEEGQNSNVNNICAESRLLSLMPVTTLNCSLEVVFKLNDTLIDMRART